MSVLSTVQDPFEQVIRNLWETVLEKHSGITDNVSAGNRIKRYASKSPVKGNRQNADYPEIDLIPGAFTRGGMTRDTLIASQDYLMTIASGTEDLDAKMTLLQWEALRAFEAAEHDADGAFNLGLEWVTSVSMVLMDLSDTDVAAQRGRVQWTAIATITVNFAFDRAKHLRDNQLT